MNIVTYNVNGIRAALRKGFCEWLESTNADVVCLQEIKATADQIPQEEFEALGYHCYWHPAEKKGYSGVAILSKTEPDTLIYKTGIDYIDKEGRVLQADFGDLRIVSAYFPSGSSGDLRQDIKMQFLADMDELAEKWKKERPKLIIAGDYNICHTSIDIHDPIRNATSSGFLPEERAWIGQFLERGFTDSFRHFNPEPHNYTWWSYRANARANNKGWRIDYLMTSKALDENLKRCVILPNAMHSDHCPVLLEVF